MANDALIPNTVKTMMLMLSAIFNDRNTLTVAPAALLPREPYRDLGSACCGIADRPLARIDEAPGSTFRSSGRPGCRPVWALGWPSSRVARHQRGHDAEHRQRAKALQRHPVIAGDVAQ